jgi:hypothetical protein
MLTAQYLYKSFNGNVPVGAVESCISGTNGDAVALVAQHAVALVAQLAVAQLAVAKDNGRTNSSLHFQSISTTPPQRLFETNGSTLFKPVEPWTPPTGSLYLAHIVPLLPMTFKAAIW